MNCIVIDGKMVAQKLRTKTAAEAAAFLEKTGRKPGLATILVGNNPASQAYVAMKHRACQEAGILSLGITLAATAQQQEVEHALEELAQDPAIDGILVQLPLPQGLDSEAILSKIPIDKDVDGFHPLNAGLLARRGAISNFIPCTPLGCIHLLEHYRVPISGKQAVILGRSNLVGLPMALLLLEKDATVTIVHSRTPNREELIGQADILVAAMGRPQAITGPMLKPGAAVLDVGINKIIDPTSPKGYSLVGDVDFQSATKSAGWITPVPGGVGPMTIAVLLENTLKAAQNRVSLGLTTAKM